MLSALRVSGSPVIVDLSGCDTLNYQDIDLLLECIAQVAGRDTELLLVAGARSNRVLLEVTRIASLVPVFNSLNEAIAYPETLAESNANPPSGPNTVEDQHVNKSQTVWSA